MRSATDRWIVVFALLCGCSGDGGSKEASDLRQDVHETTAIPDLEGGQVGDVVADLPNMQPEVAEVVPDIAPDLRLAPSPGKVLLLDFEMRHPVSWAFVIEELKQLEHEVEYRRWYPHATLADVEPHQATGELPYSLIIVSAGNAPSEPSERMRGDDAANLASYLEHGGNLMLLIRHTWLDGYGGDCDWFWFNRLLESAGVSVRVPRNTAVGFVHQPSGGKPPHHFEVAQSYPGSLEWTIAYPTGFPDETHPAVAGQEVFAAGVTSTISCDADDVAVLAWTHANILLWRTLDNSVTSIDIPLIPQPLAVTVPVGDGGGFISVAPRSVMQLPVHTEYMSDKPILNFDQLDATEAFAKAVLSHVSALTIDPTEHSPQGCHTMGEGGMFSPHHAELPNLGGGEKIAALFPPSTRPVALAPPAPPEGAPGLGQDLPQAGIAQPTKVPDWYVNGRARFGWGGAKPYEEMKQFFQQALDSGITCFVVGADANWLVNYANNGSTEPPPFYDVAKAAEDTGAKLFLGVNWIIGKYGELKDDIGQAQGAYGQILEAPPPLSDLYWSEAIEPMVMGAAKIANAHPGIMGINIDLELYGAGSLWYANGYAFGEDTWAKQMAAVAVHAPDLGDQMAALEPPERLPWLVDQGLIGFVFQSLADETAKRAAAIRESAHALNPDFELAFYGVMLSTSWLYYGWMKGMGTPERPATHLSYDIATNRAREILNDDGIHMRHLGGILGVLFDPQDLEKGLFNTGSRADGYWLFQFTDFPVDWDPENPPKLNGLPDEYWQAIAAANDLLNGLP